MPEDTSRIGLDANNANKLLNISLIYLLQKQVQPDLQRRPAVSALGKPAGRARGTRGCAPVGTPEALQGWTGVSQISRCSGLPKNKYVLSYQ